MESASQIVNRRERFLDLLARTRVRILGTPFPAFQVCGYTGVVMAVALAMTLIARLGLSYWVMAAIVLSAMGTFLGLVAATKVITGEEQIIYYHHEIAVMLVSALVAKLLHQALLPYMDVTILGIGAFLACGRIGCLMVGCCHGRPFVWGIRYREEHATEGFAHYLVGIPLFPIQALESLWVVFVVAAGVAMMWTGSPPGSALAWYTVSYGAARFSLEFIRGDIERPYTWGFSQGQWLSLWLITSLIVAEWSGRMPFHAWHTAVGMALALAMAAVALQRKLDLSQRFRTLHPYHVREVAGAVSRLAEKAPALALVRTSLGIQISGSAATGFDGYPVHYTLSRRSGNLSRATAQLLSDLILCLKRRPHAGQLIDGNLGTFHVLLPGSGKDHA